MCACVHVALSPIFCELYSSAFPRAALLLATSFVLLVLICVLGEVLNIGY